MWWLVLVIFSSLEALEEDQPTLVSSCSHQDTSWNEVAVAAHLKSWLQGLVSVRNLSFIQLVS